MGTRGRRYKRSVRGRFTNGRASAKYRKIEWALDFEQYCQLVADEECHYCGGPLSGTGASLDRKNNLEPYCMGNVVPCCLPCNTMKGDRLTYSEMVLAMAVVKASRGLE